MEFEACNCYASRSVPTEECAYLVPALTLATFFIDRDAESDEAELASVKSIKALQAEITGLRTDVQALVSRDLDSAK